MANSKKKRAKIEIKNQIFCPRGGEERMTSLSPEHHGELNKVGVSAERFAELRAQYADDPVAQQQIDGYDDNSEYYRKLVEYREGLKSDKEVSELETW